MVPTAWRESVKRWFHPDPVAYVPPERRERVAIPLVAALCALAITARLWLGLSLWVIGAAALVTMCLALVAIDRWVRRIGVLMTRSAYERRRAEDVLATPKWRRFFIHTFIVIPGALSPILQFDPNQRADADIWFTHLAAMLPIVVLAGLVLTFSEHSRAARLLTGPVDAA
jgi:hypothetical protein